MQVIILPLPPRFNDLPPPPSSAPLPNSNNTGACSQRARSANETVLGNHDCAFGDFHKIFINNELCSNAGYKFSSLIRFFWELT